MERLSAMDIRKGLGEVLSRVKLRGEEFVLEKGGKPTAVLLPYHKFALARDNAWNRIFKLVSEKDPKVDMNGKEVGDLVDQAIHKIRRSKKKSKTA